MAKKLVETTVYSLSSDAPAQPDRRQGERYVSRGGRVFFALCVQQRARLAERAIVAQQIHVEAGNRRVPASDVQAKVEPNPRS